MEPTSIADAEARALSDAYMEDDGHVGVRRAVYAAYRAGRNRPPTGYEVHRAAFAMAAAWNVIHDDATTADEWEAMARVALDAAREGHEETLPPGLLAVALR